MNKEDIKLIVELIKELPEESRKKYSKLVKKIEILDKLAELNSEMTNLQNELNKISM